MEGATATGGFKNEILSSEKSRAPTRLEYIVKTGLVGLCCRGKSGPWKVSIAGCRWTLHQAAVQR
jgi:hypothetical protein